MEQSGGSEMFLNGAMKSGRSIFHPLSLRMPDKIASGSCANTQATFLLGTGFTFLTRITIPHRNRGSMTPALLTGTITWRPKMDVRRCSAT
jgi:hypothetical protein